LPAALPAVKTLRGIVSAWPVKVRQMEARRSVVRVRAGEGDFCLKPVTKSQGRLEFMLQVQEHARRRGFAGLQSLLRTHSGDIAAWDNGVAWTLTPWVEGVELSYDKPEDLNRAARVLAGFHVAVSDFPRRDGDRLKSNIGKWPAKIAGRAADLLTASVLCAGGPAGRDEFGALLASQRPRLEEHCAVSLRSLGSPGYSQVCRSYRDDVVPVCHGDPAAHNFIVRPGGGVELIDLNSLRADLPCVDAWKLLSRLGFHHRWEPGRLVPVLEAYSSVRPLSGGEAGVLLGLLWFPEKLWRLTVEAEKAGGEWLQAGGPLPQGLVREMRTAAGALKAKEQCLRVLEGLLAQA